MNAIWRSDSNRIVQRVLRQLASQLNAEYRNSISDLKNLSDHPEQARELTEAILFVSRMRSDVLKTLNQETLVPPDTVSHELSRFSAEVIETLRSQPEEYRERQSLAEVLRLLVTAEAQVFAARGKIRARDVRKVMIGSDLLFQAHFSLFPAERMLVGSALTTRTTSVVRSLFEVTGIATSGHVQADPSLLAKALISMDATDAFLLVWIHSHPGGGHGGTTPSPIDHRQHRDWIRDYSPNLLSIIMVSDGHFRLWGTALRSGKIQVEITGTGIQKTEGENVYRLSFQ